MAARELEAPPRRDDSWDNRLIGRGVEETVAVFATLDATWLALEGAAQWTAVAWLAHPAGGGMDQDAAVKRMLGARRWWAQDESLGLFLVLDRLLPNWPELTFGAQGMGAVELLETALRH